MSEKVVQTIQEAKNIYLSQILKEEKEEGEEYEKNYKKTGKKSKDYDEDGEVEDEADEYAGVKDKAIKKAKKSECGMKTESFSDWRTDLYEVISKIGTKEDDKIKDGPRKNKININPSISEDVVVLGENELNEEFLTETVNIATDHLYEMGLNEQGLELVIEDLGAHNFVEYVFNVSENYLLAEDARQLALYNKKGSPINPNKELKGAAAQARFKSSEPAGSRKPEKVETKKETKASPGQLSFNFNSNSNPVSKKVSVDRGNKAVQSAVAQQPKTKSHVDVTKDRIAKGILSTIDAYQRGMERHRQATGAASKMASQTSQTASTLAKGLSKGASAAAKGIGSGILTAAGLQTLSGKDTPLSRAIADRRNKKRVNENVKYILEKAVSEQQQKIFGVALAVKRGEVSRSKVSEKVLEIADNMSEKEIRKFASTSHSDIPKRKS
jgi:hypothetical protein